MIEVISTFIIWLMLLMATSVPNRNYGIYLFWLVALICTYLLDVLLTVHWSDQNVGYTFGMLMIIAIGLGAGLLIALLQGIYVWAVGREARERLAAWEGTLQICIVPLVLVGILIALFVTLQLRIILQIGKWAWLAHGLAIAIVVAVWMPPRILPKWANAEPHRYAAWMLTGIRWSLPIFVAAFTALLVLVAQRAEEIAAGRPYCIQVADTTHVYRTADTLLDLSGLTMRSSMSAQHHAVLLVQPGYQSQSYYWSYREQTFVPVRFTRPRVVCTPKDNFVQLLPWIFAD